MATNPQAIANALPQLITAEQKLSQIAATKGIRYRIAPFGGIRSQADTTRILKYRDDDYAVYVKQVMATGKNPIPKEEWRKIAPFGSSFHNYGAAFDVQIVTKPSNMTNKDAINLLGSHAEECGLRWGAQFGDDPHFELRITLAQAAELWKQSGKQAGVGASPVAVVGIVAILGLLLFGVRSWLR